MEKDKEEKEQSKEEQNNEEQNREEENKEVTQTKNDKPTAPDVVLDVPELKVDKINIKVRNLEARVALNAEISSMLKVGVGAQVRIGKVDVDIEGVKAQAHLRIRLERVKAIVNRTVETLDRNPDLIRAVLKPVAEGVGEAAEDVGEGTGGLVSNLGEGFGEVVDGVDQAAEKVGDAVTDNAVANEIKDKIPGVGSKDQD